MALFEKEICWGVGIVCGDKAVSFHREREKKKGKKELEMWRGTSKWNLRIKTDSVARRAGFREKERFLCWSHSPALLIIPKYALLLSISSSLADHTGLVLKNIFTNLIRQPNTPGKLL